MKKKCYDAPDMEVIHVELEKGFMAASVVDKDDPMPNSDVTAGSQAIGEEFDFTNNEWQ